MKKATKSEKDQNIFRTKKFTTTEHAFVYLVDCTLATVTSLAMRKSRSKSEYARQIAIAQTGINFLMVQQIDPLNSRAKEVINNHGGSVEGWASLFDILQEPANQ
jgi:hypothetical protein